MNTLSISVFDTTRAAAGLHRAGWLPLGHEYVKGPEGWRFARVYHRNRRWLSVATRPVLDLDAPVACSMFHPLRSEIRGESKRCQDCGCYENEHLQPRSRHLTATESLALLAWRPR